jgi:hypothetical protein
MDIIFTNQGVLEVIRWLQGRLEDGWSLTATTRGRFTVVKLERSGHGIEVEYAGDSFAEAIYRLYMKRDDRNG